MDTSFVITTDTSSDLPQEYIDQHQLNLVTLYFIVDGVTYGYNCPQNMDVKEFYQKMRDGSAPKTQQADPEHIKTVFEPLLRQGKDILHLSFSSGLSGTTNSCRIAAEDLLEQYPERRIVVIDTLAASLGVGLLVHYALGLQQQGKTLDEIAQWVEDNKLHLCHYFTVEDLTYLQRGGRISKATALVGGMIGIKPVLHVDNDGHLVAVSKVRGRKQSLNALVDKMEATVGSFRDKNQVVFISHGDCLDDANYVAEQVKARFGIEHFLISDISPVIGSHSGPGTIALFFLGDQR